MLVPRQRRRAIAITLVLIGAICGGLERPAHASATWSEALPARLGTQSRFKAVACTSTANCVAVGSYHRRTGETQTLAEHWDGAAWSIDRVPHAGHDSELRGVTCTSSKRCVAVGNFTNDAGVQKVLIERWEGAVWTRVASSSPPGLRFATLESVSCSKAASCLAVGGAIDAAGIQVALSERWDGAAWSIVTVPSRPAASTTVLWSTTCTSATDCVAVGSSQDATTLQHRTLVEHWDGTNWTIVASPNPTDAYSSQLHGVSCTSASECVAVGNVLLSPSGPFITLVEHWDGNGWTIVPSPNRPEIDDLGWSSLNSVSCASATNCTAVGSFTHYSDGSFGATVDDTLVEHWDGATWVLVAAPDPGWNAALSSVSCISATDCLAVGLLQTVSLPFFDKTLALRSA